MKIQIKSLLILCLCLIEVCSIFLMWKSLSGRETYLDNVNLKDIKNNSMLAIMLEQSDGSYIESDSNTWPTDMKYNETLSDCIDALGNKINGALTYDSSTNIATVESGVTSYCYLYFDMIKNVSTLCTSGDNLGNCLLTNNASLDSLNDAEKGGLYRYQGTNDLVNDNYICFGTNDKSECTSNTDAYMYRIMGVNSNGQLKLIKKEALNSTMQWYSNYNADITWPNSTIYKELNGSSFLSNTTYVPSG